MAWDLAPHDISIALYIMGEMPTMVNCRGSAHVTPGIEDVTSMCLTFPKQRTAIIHSSWLDPRKVREMTIVGSRRMIVYDDVTPLEKIRIFDARVERPPHYDTFAEFHYAYHYGDMYAPYIKQEEPLKSECQHFLDCIRDGTKPLTDGQQGSGTCENIGSIVGVIETQWRAHQSCGAAQKRGEARACRSSGCCSPTGIQWSQWEWERKRKRKWKRARSDDAGGDLTRLRCATARQVLLR